VEDLSPIHWIVWITIWVDSIHMLLLLSPLFKEESGAG
jgi:hypothetical protein